MSVRVFASGRISAEQLHAPEYIDSSVTQRETTVNGYTFHWGINETRNFLDDGLGLAHAAFRGNATIDQMVQDIIPFGDARS